MRRYYVCCRFRRALKAFEAACISRKESKLAARCNAIKIEEGFMPLIHENLHKRTLWWVGLRAGLLAALHREE
jgi:hypothetical protein